MDVPEEESNFCIFESSYIPDVNVLNFEDLKYSGIDFIPKL